MLRHFLEYLFQNQGPRINGSEHSWTAAFDILMRLLRMRNKILSNYHPVFVRWRAYPFRMK